MSMFRALVFSSVLVGLIVGGAVTVAQHFGTIPLILKGEVYEEAAESEHARHESAVTAWEPRDGFERNAYTTLANILTATGFALLLAGIYAMRSRPVTWREGLFWGLSGFLVFTVAPSLGLPPQLPGTPVAPIEARQFWWIATAAATAGGLGLIVFQRAGWAVALGILVIVLPHVIGAPQLPESRTNVPEALSREFVTTVIVTSLLFWVLLGSLTAILLAQFNGRNDHPENSICS